MILDEHPVSGAVADDGTQLCVSQHPKQAAEDDLDRMMGHLRFPDDSTWEFSKFRDARLAFGLWEQHGPFDLDVAPAVPVDIATAKTAAVVAWVHLAPEQGEVRTRAGTADIVGVNRQSVSNYLNDMRYELGE